VRRPSWRKIGRDVYWLSVPDTESALFENIWPIPKGVNYNAYLVGDGSEYLLIDSSKNVLHAEEFLGLIAEVINPSRIKAVAVLHTEPDHSGLVEDVSRLIGKPTVFSTSRASAFMKSLYGLNTKVVKDGETIKVGNRNLKVIELSWVHWPDTMFLHLEDEGLLFSSDAFGSFGALERPVLDDELDFGAYMDLAKEYFATVVLSYRRMVVQDLEKVNRLGLNIKMIAPAHGAVLKSRIHEFTRVLASWCILQKRNKVTVVYGSMYGFTGVLAGFAAECLSERAKEVALRDVVKDRIGLILSDMLDSAGVVFLTPTYETNVFPAVSNLVNVARIKKLGEGKLAAGIVTKLWGGTAATQLMSSLKEAGYDVPSPVVECTNYPDDKERESLRGYLLDFAGKATSGL